MYTESLKLKNFISNNFSDNVLDIISEKMKKDLFDEIHRNLIELQNTHDDYQEKARQVDNLTNELRMMLCL